MRGDIPESRKRVASEDITLEQEPKRARSPRPSEASSASHPPSLSVVGHAGRSKERACTPTSLGSVRAHDPQRGEAPSVAPTSAPRADGHGDSWANREQVRSAPPSVNARGHGSQLMSNPHPVGSSPVGRGFRALPLSSRYASMFLFNLTVEFFERD